MLLLMCVCVCVSMCVCVWLFVCVCNACIISSVVVVPVYIVRSIRCSCCWRYCILVVVVALLHLVQPPWPCVVVVIVLQHLVSPCILVPCCCCCGVPCCCCALYHCLFTYITVWIAHAALRIAARGYFFFFCTFVHIWPHYSLCLLLFSLWPHFLLSFGYCIVIDIVIVSSPSTFHVIGLFIGFPFYMPSCIVWYDTIDTII